MLFLTYIKFIFSLSIEICFKNIAINSSLEIEEHDFEKNGCILFGFYLIICNVSQIKLLDELKKINNKFSYADWKKVKCLIFDLGHISAIRLLTVAKLLPEKYKITHESFKTEILEILDQLNGLSQYIIKYLNEKTEQFARETDLYNENISEFFIKYFNFIIVLYVNNPFAFDLLYINYIIISKNLSADDSERNIVKEVISNEYKGKFKSLWNVLSQVNDDLDGKTRYYGISNKTIKEIYQNIYQKIGR